MTHHPDSEVLSAFADQELSLEERAPVAAHVASCPPCQDSLAGFQRIKSLAGALPRKTLPEGWSPLPQTRPIPSPWEWLKNARPTVWAPALGFALLLAVTAGWLFFPKHPETIPLEALLAAHDRYLDEGLLPPADLSSGSFSAKLASYEESE